MERGGFTMLTSRLRLAVRAVILHENRLLLVNAFPNATSDLWCAPGGGVEQGQTLPENLAREVHEETGLHIGVERPCLVNEFHSPDTGFHQVEVFFRCVITNGTLRDDWQDPEAIVTERRWFTRSELSAIRLKPDALPGVAWDDGQGLTYDPMEALVR